MKELILLTALAVAPAPLVLEGPGVTPALCAAEPAAKEWDACEWCLMTAFDAQQCWYICGW